MSECSPLNLYASVPFLAQWHTRPRVQRALRHPRALSIRESDNEFRKPRAKTSREIARLCPPQSAPLLPASLRRPQQCNRIIPPMEPRRKAIDTEEEDADDQPAG